MADNNASLPVQLVNDLVASIQTTLAEADRRIRSIENRQIGRTGLARMFEGIDGIPLRPMPLDATTHAAGAMSSKIHAKKTTAAKINLSRMSGQRTCKCLNPRCGHPAICGCPQGTTLWRSGNPVVKTPFSGHCN
jgi:hypothetical protein